MTDLAEKLEGAAAGSRELDGAIHRLLFPEDLIMTDVGSVGPVMRPCKREPLSDVPHLGDLLIAEMIGVSGYSTSIDAAVALAKQELPGCIVDLSIHPDRPSFGSVDFGQRLYASKASTPSLALCAALIRARATEAQP